MLIVGVAELASVDTLGVILLFVSVFVLDIEGTTTHSTARTHAALLLRVVSEACQSSTDQQDTALEVQIFIVQNQEAIDQEAKAHTVTKLAQVVIEACVA